MVPVYADNHLLFGQHSNPLEINFPIDQTRVLGMDEYDPGLGFPARDDLNQVEAPVSSSSGYSSASLFGSSFASSSWTMASLLVSSLKESQSGNGFHPV